MCYYDYIRLQCGCRFWGARRRRCREDAAPGCGIKRVHKHLYSPRGIYCKTHEISKVLSSTSSEWPSQLLPPVRGCKTAGCILPAHHRPPHVYWTECATDGCHLHTGHGGKHGEFLLMSSMKQAQMHDDNIRRIALQLQQLNLVILHEMGKRRQAERVAVSRYDENYGWKSIERGTASFPDPLRWHLRPKVRGEAFSWTRPLMEPRPAFHSDRCETPYQPLNLQKQEIRLYELLPCSFSNEIRGRFVHVPLDNCPSFTALSYTWGPEEADKRTVMVDDTMRIPVRKNLWDFLRRQSALIRQPRFFWIDAVCINQEVVSERNHQVSMMKRIYSTASYVYIWLGAEAEDSDCAMDWLKRKASQKLRPRGPGYHPIWNRVQGKALVRLCERPYWRRMWIIQEILHAERIVMWCGSKWVEWNVIEQLYLTLKSLQDEAWDAHHESVLGVLHSAAAVMAWQRAHWRHPSVTAPRLQTLVEVFQEWQCGDVRDKVFALVSMASRDTAIEPDYSLTVRDVFVAVRDKHADSDWKFENLLSQLLGLSQRDISLLHGQQL